MRRRLAAVFALVVGAATLALAIAVAMTEFPRGRRPTFEVDADQPVPAGVDGEALVLDAPLHFRIRPGVLWVHIARKHPGASPSATAPEGIRAGLVELARIGFGHREKPASSTTERTE